MTPIERAARAHYSDAWDGKPFHAWEDVDEVERQGHIRAVRAVLTAIREPSEVMVVEGDRQFRNSIRFDKAALAWQAMIDAALEE